MQLDPARSPRQATLGLHDGAVERVQAAERDQAILGGPLPAVQVLVDDAEIIEGDVGELRTARAIAHCPDIRSAGLQPFVNLDVAVLVELHAGLFET